MVVVMSAWPGSSFRVKILSHCSSKCVAYEWRSECRLASLVMDVFSGFPSLPHDSCRVATPSPHSTTIAPFNPKFQTHNLAGLSFYRLLPLAFFFLHYLTRESATLSSPPAGGAVRAVADPAVPNTCSKLSLCGLSGCYLAIKEVRLQIFTPMLHRKIYRKLTHHLTICNKIIPLLNNN